MKRIIMLFVSIAVLCGISVIAALSASASSCGPDTAWSKWSTSKPATSEFIQIQKAKFYSTRTKSTTTSEQAGLEGWTQDGDPEVSYGEWSAWSTSPWAATDTLQIETKSDVVSYNMTTCTFGRNSDGYRCYFPNDAARSGYTRRTPMYTAVWSVDQLNGAAAYYDGQWYNGPTSVYGYVFGGTGYVLGESVPWYVASANYGTYYRCRTVTTTYHYYKWSSWSSYARSSTAPTASDTLEVRSKTMYRYRYVKHELSASTVVSEATCAAAGKSVQVCRNCGEVITTTIPKIAHKYNKGVITKAPTCTAAGTKTFTCTVCKAKKTKTLPVIDHNYKKTVKKATVSANGSIVYKCSMCGKVASSKTVYRIKTVKLSKTSYLVNGRIQKPTVTIKNSKGKDIAAKYYTITYSNAGSKAVGSYTVTVKFKGLYAGTKVLTYKIVKPGKVTGIKQYVETGISFRWDKVAGAKGYEVFIAPASTGTFRKVATQTSNSLRNDKIKTAVKVKVRAYVVVNDKKVYGDFSSVVTLKPIK